MADRLGFTYEPHSWDGPLLNRLYELCLLWGIVNVPLYLFYLHVLHVNKDTHKLGNPVFSLLRAIGFNDLLISVHHLATAPLILPYFSDYRAWLVNSGPIGGNTYFGIVAGSIVSSFLLVIAVNVNRLQSVLYPLKCRTWWTKQFTRRVIVLSYVPPWAFMICWGYFHPVHFCYVYPNNTDQVTEMMIGIGGQEESSYSCYLITICLVLFVCTMFMLYTLQIKALMQRVQAKRYATVCQRANPSGGATESQIVELTAAKGLLVAGSILLTPISICLVSFMLHTAAAHFNRPILFVKPDWMTNPISQHVARKFEMIGITWFAMQNPYVLLLCSRIVRDASQQHIAAIKLKVKEQTSRFSGAVADARRDSRIREIVTL